MGPAEALDLGRDAIFTLLKMSAPIMIIALIVGLAVALFQALTQIQEMTLTFVPKIIAIFVTLLVLMPFLMTTLFGFTEQIYERIAQPF